MVKKPGKAESLQRTSFLPCLRAFSAFNTDDKSAGEDVTMSFLLGALTSPFKDPAGSSQGSLIVSSDIDGSELRRKSTGQGHGKGPSTT